ncbi:nitroreductase family protein [Pyramidobacter piscolens]|uniref:nitroreductase family protein n=1 Tax=Pyramidobacter piscolens TaxID=638849 RepID=UPI001FCC4395|nr:nitroreductase family protein [Pyramidobacter piscolens]BDF79520.1 nitroreductase family protein [Pyramidobacter piscolens]
MEALECIRERRSVRRFSDAPVTREEIKHIVDTARFAPTWKDSQTVRYMAVLDPALKGRIAAEGLMGFERNAQIVAGAPALILLITLDGVSGYDKDGVPSTSKGSHWQSFDAGLAAEAFCLAAHEAGLGTVIMGVFDNDDVCRLAALPEGQSVSALIALGRPAETPAARPRKSVEELLIWR